MSTRKWLCLFAGTLALGALVGRDASAVSTRTWETSSYKEFNEGEGDDILISSLGEVGPGTVTERTELETDALWTAVRADDGTIYAGSVTDGKIFAVSGGKAKQLADLEKETPWIGALALSPDGKLYAGTVGTGSIFSVDRASGKTEKVVALDGAEHVWALVFDGKTLYAGTGASGDLFAVDVAAKKATRVWDSAETHLLAIARARDGALWIGTGDEAVLYRFDPRSAQARAIADFAGSEVKAVVEVDGAVVVAANEFEARSSGPPSPPPAKGPSGTAAKPPEPGSAPGAERPGAAGTPPRPGERKGKGGLFRVEPDGRVEQLHALSEGYFQALAVANGDVYAAAGTQGRVYQIKADRTVLTAFDVDERQVNAVMAANGGLAFVTGDGGAAYVSGGAAKDAVYTSKTFDASFPARWGNVRWRGEGSLTVETRSGNTAKPDRGWSGWQKLAGVTRAGGDASVGKVASPAGRYLQYRVTLGGAGSVLRGVTVYYLPQNQRARVTEVTVGDEPSKSPVTTAGGAAKPRSPVMKVKWKVENPDADELVYTVEVRPEGDAEWQKVPTGADPLTKAEIDWNTEALPDGHYRLRVTATDASANPRDLALEHSTVSPPFLVDNQKPQIQNLEIKHPWATARAVDSFSRIDEIAYSVDGGPWMMAFPKDGIFDDVSELFTVKLPSDLAAGPHTLSIRVADEADNIGAASVTFRVKQTP